MIGIAAVFGAISIFAADFWVKSQAKREVGEKIVEVRRREHRGSSSRPSSSRRRRCAYGMELDRAQLTEIPWPQDSLPQGASHRRCADGRGSRASCFRRSRSNEPVLLTKLSGANGRATLSNLLSPGMRAVTIKTDEIAGVGGFVTPGDRVDVVLTRDAGEIQEVAENASRRRRFDHHLRKSSSKTPRC